MSRCEGGNEADMWAARSALCWMESERREASPCVLLNQIIHISLACQMRVLRQGGASEKATRAEPPVGWQSQPPQTLTGLLSEATLPA